MQPRALKYCLVSTIARRVLRRAPEIPIFFDPARAKDAEGHRVATLHISGVNPLVRQLRNVKSPPPFFESTNSPSWEACDLALHTSPAYARRRTSQELARVLIEARGRRFSPQGS